MHHISTDHHHYPIKHVNTSKYIHSLEQQGAWRNTPMTDGNIKICFKPGLTPHTHSCLSKWQKVWCRHARRAKMRHFNRQMWLTVAVNVSHRLTSAATKQINTKTFILSSRCTLNNTDKAYLYSHCTRGPKHFRTRGKKQQQMKHRLLQRRICTWSKGVQRHERAVILCQASCLCPQPWLLELWHAVVLFVSGLVWATRLEQNNQHMPQHGLSLDQILTPPNSANYGILTQSIQLQHLTGNPDTVNTVVQPLRRNVSDLIFTSRQAQNLSVSTNRTSRYEHELIICSPGLIMPSLQAAFPFGAGIRFLGAFGWPLLFCWQLI